MSPPRVKICCISSLQEAELAVACGASAVGLVSAMPSGPGVIDEALIAEIAARVPPPVATFLLTSQTSAEAIINQQRCCDVNVLQLCDYVDPPVHLELRRELPGIRLVQVIHVTGHDAVELAREAAPRVDALLLDSGNTTLAVKQLGGTGRVHDWETSRKIRDAVRIPLFLAGGLTADNVAEAVRIVEPFGVDICSGVRTEGQLDASKVQSFFTALASAKS